MLNVPRWMIGVLLVGWCAGCGGAAADGGVDAWHVDGECTAPYCTGDWERGGDESALGCPDGGCVGCPDGGCPDLDDNPCTQAECDPKTGCQLVPLTGTACDDGSFCTDNDQCVLGQCVGMPVSCDDGDACTQDGCDAASGCSHVVAEGILCDDGDECTWEDACVEGKCLGVAADCDDGNPCTTDGCDWSSGCFFDKLNGNPCDDQSVCTTSDHCVSGVCTGTALACNDGNPCTADVCDDVVGCVTEPADGAWCNDGNACTDVDKCLGGVCTGQATACEDGNPCTIDSCVVQGGCVHTQPPGIACEDGDACTSGDKCYKGECVPGPEVSCEDGNQCTTNWCDSDQGCMEVLLDAGGCDDKDACTAGDSCHAGQCLGVPIACDDANPCTGDDCDPKTGCLFEPVEGTCDDFNACTAGDYCDAGKCHPGKDPECLAVERVVLAGDSWSAGLILPLRDALDGRGYEEVALTWELTAKPGSTVAGWLSDQNMMLSLFISLDAQPPAEILFFTLGGNDFLGACQNGLGLMGPLEWFLTMLKIQLDLQTFSALAKAGRPHLKIVLIGYDYLHFEMVQALGAVFLGFDRIKFNLGMVDLAQRGRDAAAATPDMVYAHNMGLLQYTFGDHVHPPFLCPAPALGFPEYGPGVAPKPGPAPGYSPFPGGWFTYPSPLDYIPDGIHPSYDGFLAIIENTLDQGPASWIEGKPWP